MEVRFECPFRVPPWACRWSPREGERTAGTADAALDQISHEEYCAS